MLNKKEIQLWCIHGNLQQPAVWKSFEGQFTLRHRETEPAAVLPFQLENLWKSKAEGFGDWAEQFCHKVAAASNGAPQLLMGYSQGGRLAMHAILENPQLWKGAVIVAADMGFRNPEDCQPRLQHDRRWGERFLTEPWDQFIAEWDAQEVFGGFPNAAPRNEADYSCEAIQRLFEVFSKGRQDNLRPAFQQLTAPPLLFLSGEKDPRYCQIGREFAESCPAAQHIIVPGAAHRVPWDAPVTFSKMVQQFFDTL